MAWKILIRRGVSWRELESEQQRLFDEVRTDPQRGFLLLSEPTPTFTQGRSADASELLWDTAERERRGVAVEPVSRGGRWTYHGPGQVLLYPIVGLRKVGLHSAEVLRFVNRLRALTRGYLAELGVDAEERDCPYGLFVEGAKLVSFGMHFRQGIGTHGLSLYLTPQSAYFDGIRPCGVTNGRVISLSELGVAIAWETAATGLARTVEKGFQSPKS